MDADQDMNFWRLINHEFDQVTEAKMAMRAALEYSYGDEAKLFDKYLGMTTQVPGQPDSHTCKCGHAKFEHGIVSHGGQQGCLRCGCWGTGD